MTISTRLGRAMAAGLLGSCLALPVSAVEEQGTLPLDELRTFADVYNQIRSGYERDLFLIVNRGHVVAGCTIENDPEEQQNK